MMDSCKDLKKIVTKQLNSFLISHITLSTRTQSRLRLTTWQAACPFIFSLFFPEWEQIYDIDIQARQSRCAGNFVLLCDVVTTFRYQIIYWANKVLNSNCQLAEHTASPMTGQLSSQIPCDKIILSFPLIAVYDSGQQWPWCGPQHPLFAHSINAGLDAVLSY